MTKWVTKKLGEIGRLVSGLTYSPNNVVDEGVLVLRSSNIQNDNICLEDNVYVNVTEYNPVQEGDILICVRNGSRALIGKTARINKYIEGCAFGAFMAIYRSEYNDFLYHFFKSDNFFSQVSRNIGATINSINGSDLKNMEVFFPINDDGTPDLAEQRRIAGILSSADGAIAASEALIAKYRNIKRGLLTTLLQPKEGWKKVKLGECCETELGKTLDSGRNTGEYRPYLCALNVLWGKIDLSTIKQMRIEESEKERYLVKRGDLLVCEGGEIGRCAIWNSDEEIYYQNALHRVRFKEEYDATFFMYLLGHYNDLNLIEQYGKGLTIKHLNQSSFRGIPVLIPDLAEQRRIAEILSSVDAKIAAEEKVVEKYKGVKKGLMEEMMKGNDCPKKNLE